MNALYNFQDTTILAEIFENGSQSMPEKCKFNRRKCSFASTLSGAIQGDMSKLIIYFPTNADVNALMEKSLRGGMSVVNTRVGFDSNIFIKDKQQKLIYKISNKETDEIENKRVSTFILKMDENNQYGNAMTKPVPIGCIKKEAYTPNIRELLLLLSRICHKDGMGHLFVVDLEFNVQKATEKQISFAKQKVVPARNRSDFQLFDAIRLRKIDVLNTYKCTAKAHSTMDKKYLIRLYAEHLKFLKVLGR